MANRLAGASRQQQHSSSTSYRLLNTHPLPDSIALRPCSRQWAVKKQCRLLPIWVGAWGHSLTITTIHLLSSQGLFCTPTGGHQQFPVSAPSMPPHLAAAAAAAAGYGHRLIGAGQANGCAAALTRRVCSNGIIKRGLRSVQNLPPAGGQPTSSSAPPPSHSSSCSSSSINRSQRCGVCRGCQCKPCGQCTYCQDRCVCHCHSICPQLLHPLPLLKSSVWWTRCQEAILY